MRLLLAGLSQAEPVGLFAATVRKDVQGLGRESSLILPSAVWVMGLGALVSLPLEKGVSVTFHSIRVFMLPFF